jgi:hypothetical protein
MKIRILAEASKGNKYPQAISKVYDLSNQLQVELAKLKIEEYKKLSAEMKIEISKDNEIIDLEEFVWQK